jgi:hypothetical protein
MSDATRFDEALRSLVDEFSRRLVGMFYQELQQHFQKFSSGGLLEKPQATSTAVVEAPKKRGRTKVEAKAAPVAEAKVEPLLEATPEKPRKPRKLKAEEPIVEKPVVSEKPKRGRKAQVEVVEEQVSPVVVEETPKRKIRQVQTRAAVVEATGEESKVDKRKLPRYCMLPGCTELAAGPRYGWFCRMHAASLTPEEKLAAREAKSVKPAKEVVEAVVETLEEEPKMARTPVRRNKVNPDEIKRLRKAGKTHEQIAAKLKISKATVARYVSKS